MIHLEVLPQVTLSGNFKGYRFQAGLRRRVGSAANPGFSANCLAAQAA